MELKISKINELELNKDHVEKFILLDEKIDYGDVALLFNEFKFDKQKQEKGIKLYRNLGLIFKLTKQDNEAIDNWEKFTDEVIPVKETFNKLDNIFISKYQKRILLVTNKRLMRYDLVRLNKKINEINTKIQIYNAQIIGESTKKPTLKQRIIRLFS